MLTGLALAAVIVMTGNTADATVTLTAGCGPGHGKVHYWTPTVAGPATAVMCGPFDTALYVRSEDGAVNLCNDDTASACPPSPRNSKLSWTAVAGMTYALFAIGYGADGPYTLTVETGGGQPVCPTPPRFDVVSTSNCPLEKEPVECGCYEDVTWDHSAGAEWYVVQREGPPGVILRVGDTKAHRWIIEPPDENDVYASAPQLHWVQVWDEPTPVTGVTYTYKVSACKKGPTGADLCGAFTSNSVKWTAPPIACYAMGRAVACQ